MEKVDMLSGDNIPTNEEIVDTLVKSLETSCQVKSEERTSPSREDSEEFVPQTHEGEGKENDAQEKICDDDFIDEEFLKEQEKSYSEDDKVRLRLDAENQRKVGNDQFRNGKFREAVTTYTSALRTCPPSCSKERAVLYANRAAAKLSIHLTATAIDDCSKAIELDPNYIKALMRRAQLYEKTDKLDEALEDYKRILELDSTNKEALMASVRLPPLIHERNEKLKEEMLGKLKDLGNMVLKPFGLSTNNFQMVPNESGGYSINFKQ